MKKNVVFYIVASVLFISCGTWFTVIDYHTVTRYNYNENGKPGAIDFSPTQVNLYHKTTKFKRRTYAVYNFIGNIYNRPYDDDHIMSIAVYECIIILPSGEKIDLLNKHIDIKYKYDLYGKGYFNVLDVPTRILNNEKILLLDDFKDTDGFVDKNFVSIIFKGVVIPFDEVDSFDIETIYTVTRESGVTEKTVCTENFQKRAERHFYTRFTT